MGFAFGINEEDVYNVLERNGKNFNEEEIESIFDQIDADIVEKEALRETDFDEQINAAYDEIERQLKGLGVL